MIGHGHPYRVNPVNFNTTNKPHINRSVGGGKLACSFSSFTVEIKSSDFAKSIPAAFEEIKRVLAGNGLGLKNIAKIGVHLFDMDDFEKFNKHYGNALEGHKPARVCIQKSASADSYGIMRVWFSEGPVEMVSPPEGFPPAVDPYSVATKASGIVYVSGQIVPKEPDFGKQVDGVLLKVGLVLKAAGSSMENVVSASVFVLDPAQVKELSPIMKKAFPKADIVYITAEKLPFGVGFEIACEAKQ